MQDAVVIPCVYDNDVPVTPAEMPNAALSCAGGEVPTEPGYQDEPPSIGAGIFAGTGYHVVPCCNTAEESKVLDNSSGDSAEHLFEASTSSPAI